ncbi:MAG: undecaprenyldiphospho-muramoylpentapeptide beta-N-acetylglucosaminyltransferase [Elusimicrobia bacterium]|nr:undecaprenyldiphospho-muramoylpentapeptide beta-N-acetylglucosaminyltransferase [Elusimicrobiota bacterium]
MNEENKKKILIAVSSTGGHIYPGLAIADELKRNGYDVLFVGKRNEIILKEGYRFYNISAVGFPRRLSIKMLGFFFSFLYSVMQSIKILKKEKPDIIIGFGGYVSFPVILASRFCNIKKGTVNIIHEQNFIPGLANKLSAGFSDKICVSFKESKKYFPSEKVVYTGNPIRKQILDITPLLLTAHCSLLTVLIFGGSQGAHSINFTIINSLGKFLNIPEKIRFVHITGENDYEMVKNAYSAKGLSAEVYRYIDNIESVYNRASLVICRSGATTVAELIALKLPAILIPYPYSTEGHQKANADYLSRSGSAVILEEKEIKKLPDMLLELVNHPQALLNMSESYRKLSDSLPVQSLFELVKNIA